MKKYVLSILAIMVACLLLMTACGGDKTKSKADSKNKEAETEDYEYADDNLSTIKKVGNKTHWEVKTDSMSPTIKKGDEIVTKEVTDPENELEVGDVVIYRSLMLDDSGNMALGCDIGRIAEIKDSDADCKFKSYVTKGDAETMQDTVVVYPGDVVGKWIEVNLF